MDRTRQHHHVFGTFRLRVKNLSYDYAHFAPRSADHLRDLILNNHGITTFNVEAQKKWHTAH